jgi:hypothetical protein
MSQRKPKGQPKRETAALTERSSASEFESACSYLPLTYLMAKRRCRVSPGMAANKGVLGD